MKYCLFTIPLLLCALACSNSETDEPDVPQIVEKVYPTHDELAQCFGKWYKPSSSAIVDDEGNEYVSDEITCYPDTEVVGEYCPPSIFKIIDESTIEYIDYLMCRTTTSYRYDVLTGVLSFDSESFNLYGIEGEDIITRTSLDVSVLDGNKVDIAKFGNDSYVKCVFSPFKFI